MVGRIQGVKAYPATQGVTDKRMCLWGEMAFTNTLSKALVAPGSNLLKSTRAAG